MTDDEVLDALVDTVQTQQSSVKSVEASMASIKAALEHRLGALEQMDAVVTKQATEQALERVQSALEERLNKFDYTNAQMRELMDELKKTKEDLEQSKRSAVFIYFLSSIMLLVSGAFVWWSTTCVKDALNAINESFESVNTLAQQAAEQMGIVLNPVTVTSPGIAEVMYTIGTVIGVAIGAVFLIGLVLFLKNH